MKWIVSCFMILAATSVMACPNIDGKYQLDDSLNLIIKISKSSCKQATLEMLDVHGIVLAKRVDVYDGKIRDSEWLKPYEISSSIWVGNELNAAYYIKHSGELTVSILVVLPSGDLKETQKQYLNNQTSTRTILWKRL